METNNIVSPRHHAGTKRARNCSHEEDSFDEPQNKVSKLENHEVEANDTVAIVDSDIAYHTRTQEENGHAVETYNDTSGKVDTSKVLIPPSTSTLTSANLKKRKYVETHDDIISKKKPMKSPMEEKDNLVSDLPKDGTKVLKVPIRTNVEQINRSHDLVSNGQSPPTITTANCNQLPMFSTSKVAKLSSSNNHATLSDSVIEAKNATFDSTKEDKDATLLTSGKPGQTSTSVQEERCINRNLDDHERIQEERCTNQSLDDHERITQTNQNTIVLSILTMIFIINVPMSYYILQKLFTYSSLTQRAVSTMKYLLAFHSLQAQYREMMTSNQSTKEKQESKKDSYSFVQSTKPIGQLPSSSNHKIMSLLALVFFANIGTTFSILSLTFTMFKPTTIRSIQRHHPYVIPPSYLLTTQYSTKNQPIPTKVATNTTTHHLQVQYISNMTLREFLSDERGFHLGLAPAFFGFYVYFGAMAAFHENVLTDVQRSSGMRLIPQSVDTYTEHHNQSQSIQQQSPPLVKSVAGASAGAMTAVLLAAGLNPRTCAEFVSSFELRDFADPPGIGGILKGDIFEEIMVDILRETKKKLLETNGSAASTFADDNKNKNFQLEDGYIPVGVTVFDLMTLSTKTLTKGCAGRAARASACFPIMFQPVTWSDGEDIDEYKNSFVKSLIRKILPKYLFIDGGVQDPYGLVGLSSLDIPTTMRKETKRVVNVVAGSFSTRGSKNGPPGPSQMPPGLVASEVLSISIENAPQCGPDRMENGPLAVKAAFDAVTAVLDAKLYYGEEENHYILHIDASTFV